MYWDQNSHGNKGDDVRSTFTGNNSYLGELEEETVREKSNVLRRIRRRRRFRYKGKLSVEKGVKRSFSISMFLRMWREWAYYLKKWKHTWLRS